MKKTPKEIKDSISAQIKDTKSYEREKFEIAINKVFIPSEIKKQKRMKTEIDYGNATGQEVGILSEIKNNFTQSFTRVGGIYLSSNWKSAILSLLMTMFISFFAYGIIFGFLPSDALINQGIQIQVAVGVYFSAFVIPTFIFLFWGLTTWIVELRSDNLISRMKMNGITKIQFILITMIISLSIMMALEIFICVVWMKILNIFSTSLSGSNENFYALSEVSFFLIFIKYLIFIIAIFCISLFIGFRIENKKTLLNVIISLFLLTIFNYMVDFKTYWDYEFKGFGNSSWVGVLLASTRWLNPIYASGSHLLTSLIPNITGNGIGNVGFGIYKTWFELIMNSLFIILTIVSITLVIVYSKKVVKYRAIM